LTDYLLVHGAGQGAWSWGRVWGYLTAPVEHPPRLASRPKVNKVFPMDLPSHGADAGGDTAGMLTEECVQAIVRAVERQDMHDLVLVGHGFSAPLVLMASAQLPVPPRRVVLVAGIVPGGNSNMISVLSPNIRFCFNLSAAITGLLGKELRLPRPLIDRYLCNGVEPKEIVQSVGFYGPLATRTLKTRVQREDLETPSSVTYVVLTQDRILPPLIQRKMAERIPDVDLVELEACHQAPLYRAREIADLLLSYA
jgi:pimeloyl-ACP methyl ester carboxylesterase